MTVTVLNIIPRKQAENVQTNQYTAVNCKTIIDKFTVTNVSGANVTFSCNLVATGGTADATNLVLKTRSIAPNDTYLCPELVGQSLEAGGVISTLAGTSAALVISATGREIT
jgi:IMP cyclohydrolase